MTSYAYDAVERMNSITVSNGGAALWAERYGYTTGAWEGSGETARQCSLKVETSGSERVNCYVAGERIYTLHGGTGTVGNAYWLDAASQLRGVKYGAADATGAYSGVNATTTTEWSYDAVGKRLEETSGAGTASYTVNTINQYTAITGVGALEYSARGDLTQLGDWELTCDAQGNLLRAHNTATNALAQYWRDATGHRAVKDVDGNKTLFFNLGTTPLEAYDLTANTTSSTIYEPRIDRPLAEVSDTGAITFYHQDWLGSVVLLTDALGAKIQSYTYDAWGKPSGFDAAGVGIPPASFVSRFLYTGREYDIETALYHYRARAYSPTLGRFLQPDPIDFAGRDGNLFRYVGNNPINYIDPDGGFAVLPVVAMGVAGAAVVVSAVLYQKLNYGDAIAVTPIPGIPLTFTGKNYNNLSDPAKWVTDVHEQEHQSGVRCEADAYRGTDRLTTQLLNTNSYRGRPLTKNERADLHQLRAIARSYLK